MKKKIVLILVALVMIFTSIIVFTACNPGDDIDKSFQNQDFVSYRKKIVAILKDNGIFVNDIDAKQNTASKNSNAKFQLASDIVNTNAFDEIIAKPDYLANKDDYEFALKQVFGISLRTSLCLGDGISNYFNEKQFFDIAVKIGDSYMSVSEDNNVDTVRAYYPAAENSEEMFENIEVEYKSATDYTFKFLSLGSDKLFGSGNAQKQFIMLQKDEENNSGTVIYSPNGNVFYSSEKQSVVDACLAIMGDDVFDIDKEQFYANRTNVRYTFTEEQNQALTDKYFKDIQSDKIQLQGINSVTKGGITYADSYVESESHDTAEIPEGIEYINKNFAIQDMSGTITKLQIPRSLKGVVRTHHEKTGEELDVPEIVPATELRIVLAADRNGQPEDKALKSVIVQNGSPLFKSGTGHLYTTDGKLTYIADAPIGEFSFDMLNENTLYTLERREELGYTNVCFSTTEIDIDMDANYTINENAGWGFDYIWNIVFPLLTNLQTVNIHGKYDEREFGNISFKAFNNMTVNVSVDDSWEERDRLLTLSFESANGTRRNVTVNVVGMTRIGGVEQSGNISATVNMSFPKIIYEINGIPEFNPCDGVTYVYKQTSFSAEDAENFAVSMNQRSGNFEIAVGNKSNEETLTMPEEIGFDVTELILEKSDFTKTIILNSKIKYLTFPRGYSDLSGLTLVYNGSINDFENNVQIICYGESYKINVQCTDGTKLYKGSTSIPEEELCYITLKIYDRNGALITKQVPAAKGREFNYEWCIDLSYDLEDGTYLAISDSGMIFGVDYYDQMIVNYDPENTFACHYALISFNYKLKGDETFTLVLVDTFEEVVNIQQDGLDCTMTVHWLGAFVSLNDGSTYNGVEIYLQNNQLMWPETPNPLTFDLSNGMGSVTVNYKIEYENRTLKFIVTEVTANVIPFDQYPEK